MENQKYFSIEDAIIKLTKLVKPFGRLSILEPSTHALAKEIFKKLKVSGISPTKDEIKYIAIKHGWEEKQAKKLSKFGD